MISKILKLLTNPQGALVQVVLEQAAKVFKLQKVLEYVEMENELDVSVKEMKKEFDSMKFKVNAQRDLFKDIQKQIDDVTKIAHPPAVPLKEINEFKESVTNVKWMMGIFNKMKKIPIFKSVFKNAK